MTNWKLFSFMMVMLTQTVLVQKTALAGPLEDGLAAYSSNDYQTALKLWQPLADHGNAERRSI